MNINVNPGQLYEVEQNFQANQIRYKMKAMKDLENKEFYLFGFLDIISNAYSKKLRNWYDDLSYSQKKYFIKDCEDNGIYIEQPPMHNNVTLEQIGEVYDKFNIKPVTAYVNQHGRKIKIMNKVVVGNKYIVKLKHHPKSKFSSRSTGFIDSRDVPTKTSTTKQNKSLFPTTPRLMGVYLSN